MVQKGELVRCHHFGGVRVIRGSIWSLRYSHYDGKYDLERSLYSFAFFDTEDP